MSAAEIIMHFQRMGEAEIRRVFWKTSGNLLNRACENGFRRIVIEYIK
jgi:hypothetical protein